MKSRGNLEPILKLFWNVRNRLSLSKDGLLLMNDRVVVPSNLRSQVLKNLHSAHQGVKSMTSRAQQTVYWPGIDTGIKNTRYTCKYCNEHAPSLPKEPLMPLPPPSYPFQQLAMDYLEMEQHSYLSSVDRFSGWLTIYHFPGSATGQQLISICRELFHTYGVSEEISSDGGPQFRCEEFKQFLKDWGVKQRLSSVDYPQSNGRAELGVKASKRIIAQNTSRNGSLNTDKAVRAILQYRNTPLPELGLSPAQLLLHRQLRDSVPSHPKHYRLHKEWVVSAQERDPSIQTRQ